MTAKVADFTDRVACIICDHFEDAKDNKMNIDRCMHPDNLEDQWGYKYGAWKKCKLHPHELNKRGLCKKWEELSFKEKLQEETDEWLDKVLD